MAAGVKGKLKGLLDVRWWALDRSISVTRSATLKPREAGTNAGEFCRESGCRYVCLVRHHDELHRDEEDARF